jgi:hypothetical protein
VNGIVFAVVVLATSIVLVAVLAWVSRRLLGLPVGALRALIAGLVGFVAALIVGQALRATESGHLAAFFSVALGVPLIVAMIFIVAVEALVPTGAGPQPVDLVLRAQRSIARSRRYAQISRILVRHGLGPYLQLSAVGRGDPAALRDALLELVTRPDDIDEQQLERALGRFMARNLAGGAATAEMFTDLFRLASRFELSIPPEVATVLRALGTRRTT